MVEEEMAKRVKRVAIVGKGPGRGLAPRVKTKGTQIWGINNTWVGQYVDMIIDVHNLDWTLEECIEQYGHLRAQGINEEEILRRAEQRMRTFRMTKEKAIRDNTPIMSSRTYVLDGVTVPGFRFPLEKVVEKFDCDNFSSATPYGLAYAIWRKFTHIDLYGINCKYNEEWSYQRDAVVGWLMFAKGRGIKVTVSGEAERPLRTWNNMLYGFEIPQRVKGVVDKDANVNLETGEEFKFDVWREY
jgi:hypothetical protein